MAILRWPAATMSSAADSPAPTSSGTTEDNPGLSVVASSTMVGTPRQLVEQIQEWESEGVSRIMLQYQRPPSREALQLIAEEVLPQVQR